jgi:hypothetical protein
MGRWGGGAGTGGRRRRGAAFGRGGDDAGQWRRSRSGAVRLGQRRGERRETGEKKEKERGRREEC